MDKLIEVYYPFFILSIVQSTIKSVYENIIIFSFLFFYKIFQDLHI
jgi:hypothetical protein